MRFRFDEEWVAKTLGEVIVFKTTNSFSRDNLNYEKGVVKNIHYGDIHTKFRTLFDITKEIVPFVNEKISIKKISEDYYCQEGDIVFADASEDLNDVGKSIEIVNLNNEKLLAGLHTLLARPKKNYFQIGFAGYLFKSKNVRTQIQKEAQGTKVLSISSTRISNLKLYFPSIPEQQKITSFLSLIDERIQTQSEVIEELMLLKTALSKKIFTQQFRFSEYSKTWKVMKLSEILSIPEKIKPVHIDRNKLITVKLHLKGVLKNDNSETLILGATNYFIRKRGQFIYGKQNLFNGALGIIPDELDGFLSSGDIPSLDINHSKVNASYLLHFLGREDFYRRLEDIAIGSGSKRIHETTLLNVEISLPPIEEQIKIADFLSTIDEKINVEEQILQQYENQKDYLLQSMFI